MAAIMVVCQYKDTIGDNRGKDLAIITKEFCFFPHTPNISSSFLHILTLDMVSISNFNHSNKCVVISHCGFYVHFLNE